MGTVRTVTGAAAVLSLKGGGERYLYRGAPVGDGFLTSSVQHAVSVGLVSEIEVPDPIDAKAAQQKPTGK